MTYSWYGAEVLELLSYQSWMSSKMFQRDRNGERESVYTISELCTFKTCILAVNGCRSPINNFVALWSPFLLIIWQKFKGEPSVIGAKRWGYIWKYYFIYLFIYFVDVKFSCHNPTKCFYGYHFPIKINIKLSYKAVMIFNCLFVACCCLSH